MRWQFPHNPNPQSFSSLALEFLVWADAQMCLSRESIAKYGECLKQALLLWGDRPVSDLTDADLTRLRLQFRSRDLSVSRQTSILIAVKRFLLFCHDRKHFPLQIDAKSITPPRRPRRQVVFLTPAEVSRFVDSIPLLTYRGHPHMAGLRLRAIVEVILGSAMRISEVLSLDKTSIDFVRKEARIIGKGNKQRTVFFTERALSWIKRYLEARADQSPALFVCHDGRSRLKRDDLWRYFQRHRDLAGINKKVTPHILRHTAATQLLFNGCPMGHIKDILGHENLETTCRYYLGVDQRAAKAAHEKYLNYDTVAEEGTS
jgi:site-specific recombinase XerD